MKDDEIQIRELLGALTLAIYRKDADAIIATLSDDEVTFDLAPPLRMDRDDTHDPTGLQTWFSNWIGPIRSESHDLEIEVGGDLAYAYGIQHMSGIKTDGEHVDL